MYKIHHWSAGGAGSDMYTAIISLAQRKTPIAGTVKSTPPFWDRWGPACDPLVGYKHSCCCQCREHTEARSESPEQRERTRGRLSSTVARNGCRSSWTLLREERSYPHTLAPATHSPRPWNQGYTSTCHHSCIPHSLHECVQFSRYIDVQSNLPTTNAFEVYTPFGTANICYNAAKPNRTRRFSEFKKRSWYRDLSSVVPCIEIHPYRLGCPVKYAFILFKHTVAPPISLTFEHQRFKKKSPQCAHETARR